MRKKKGKICSKCGEWKKLDEFHKNKKSKDGRLGRCKKCISEYRKTYFKTHKKWIAEYQKVYYLAHKKKLKEYKKRYYKAHREEILEKGKAYRKSLR